MAETDGLIPRLMHYEGHAGTELGGGHVIRMAGGLILGGLETVAGVRGHWAVPDPPDPQAVELQAFVDLINGPATLEGKIEKLLLVEEIFVASDQEVPGYLTPNEVRAKLTAAGGTFPAL